MHTSTRLLDEVLDLIRSEMAALSAEDLDKAEELSAHRNTLLEQAWERREGCDEQALRAHLLRVQAAQTGLVTTAENLRQKYRQQQSAGRKQAKYFDTERHLHAETKKAFYFDTRS